jgi:hypothetical protein
MSISPEIKEAGDRSVPRLCQQGRSKLTGAIAAGKRFCPLFVGPLCRENADRTGAELAT